VIWPECHAKIYSPYTGKSRDNGEVVEKDGKQPIKGEKNRNIRCILDVKGQNKAPPADKAVCGRRGDSVQEKGKALTG
jgi:hypothetical protein